MITRNCSCGNEIPYQRLEALPHTRTCVGCSTEAPKAGRVVTHGQGEEIYTEVEILPREVFKEINKLERTRGVYNGKRDPLSRVKDYETDDTKDDYVRYQNSNEEKE